MKRVIQTAAKIYQWIEVAFSRASSGIIILMMFLTTADVIGRYLFKSPIVGAYELSEVLLVGMVFLGIAYVQSRKGHVRVDVITSWLPEKGQLALETFGFLVGLAIMAVITWRGGISAWNALITRDFSMGMLHMPLWPSKGVIPIGAGLLCLRLIGDIVSNFARMLPGASK